MRNKSIRKDSNIANNNELKWGSVLSYAQMILSVVIGIVYTPIMIRLLGKSEYGLYNTVASTISMLSILSLGLNSSYIRFYARYKKEGELDKVFRLNGLYLLIFSIIGIIAFVCGMFLSSHLSLIFDTGLTATEYKTGRILMILLTISLTLQFPMSVFSTIITANERFIFLKLLSMIKTVVGPLVTLPILLMGFRSIGMVASTLVISVIVDCIFIYYVFVRLKNRFLFSQFEKGLFQSLFTYSVFIAINVIVDQVNNSVDRVLLGRFNGTATVAVYAVGANLYMHYMNISTAVSTVFTPKIHTIYNAFEDSFERNYHLSELFIKVGRVQFLILMLFASGIVFFGKAFIFHWVGTGYEDSYYVALLLILPVSIPLIQNLGIEIQRAANKHQFRSIIYLGMAMVNFALTIYLCRLFGAIGAAVGTAVSFIIANGLVMNIYYYKAIGLNIPEFWKNIVRMAIGMAPAFAIGCFISWKANFATVWGLLLWILIYTVVYISCTWLFSMNQFEKTLISGPVKSSIQRIRERIF